MECKLNDYGVAVCDKCNTPEPEPVIETWGTV
jgi:hypothetical protein